MKVLMVGIVEEGSLAFLVADATWATIASIADGLQACSTRPIVWAAYEVPEDTVAVNEALIRLGLGDRPLADLAA